eukprot:COSAG02_NODE_190_length_30025_cov_22.989875_19_plen_66_part_00
MKKEGTLRRGREEEVHTIAFGTREILRTSALVKGPHCELAQRECYMSSESSVDGLAGHRKRCKDA